MLVHQNGVVKIRDDMPFLDEINDGYELMRQGASNRAVIEFGG